MERLKNFHFEKKHLVYIFLFVLILAGNVSNFQVFGRIAIKLSDVLALILGLVFLKSFWKEKIDFSVGIMLIWSILSLALILMNVIIYQFDFEDVLTAVLYLFRFIFMMWLANVVARYMRSKGLGLFTLKYINVLYLLVCGFGFIQLIFFPVAYDFYRLLWTMGVFFPNADPHINRLFSTYLDPNYLAACLLIGVCVDLYLLSLERDKKRQIKYWLFLAVYTLTIFLTRSRSGLLGLVIILFLDLLLSIDRKNMKIWVVVAAAGALAVLTGLFVFSDITVFVRIRTMFTDASAGARLSSWAKGLETFWDNFLGLGYNLFGSYNKKIYGSEAISVLYGNDSSLILTLITTGIPGLALFFVHIFRFVVKKNVPKAMISLIFAALVICNFNNLLYYGLWVFPFYFIMYLTLHWEQSDIHTQQLLSQKRTPALRSAAASSK